MNDGFSDIPARATQPPANRSVAGRSIPAFRVSGGTAGPFTHRRGRAPRRLRVGIPGGSDPGRVPADRKVVEMNRILAMALSLYFLFNKGNQR